MKVVLVSTGVFQEHIIDNIKNLKMFGNNDIDVITEPRFFYKLKEFEVSCIDSTELSDFGYINNSKLDRYSKGGFWLNASLRFFYIYSYLLKYNISNCVHLENDVISYINFETLFKTGDPRLHVAFDCDKRVIPSVVYIPTAESLRPVIENYSPVLNDMENLSRFDLYELPIVPIFDNTIHRLNKHYEAFGCIFDAAAMGQYLGGVDECCIQGDTRGFVNETCLIKYDQFKFKWIQLDGLYVPHLVCNDETFRIVNLHIHSKRLYNFMGDNPKERFLIT
jgi:hypothetical protein